MNMLNKQGLGCVPLLLTTFPLNLSGRIHSRCMGCSTVMILKLGHLKNNYRNCPKIKCLDFTLHLSILKMQTEQQTV